MGKVAKKQKQSLKESKIEKLLRWRIIKDSEFGALSIPKHSLFLNSHRRHNLLLVLDNLLNDTMMTSLRCYLLNYKNELI